MSNSQETETRQPVVNHQEWEKENSLTAPEDRDREAAWRPEQGAPALTETEVTEALKGLNNTAFTEKFPRVDRTYADPPPPMQNIGLISFTPAKGATPNQNGVYGFAKLRGNYGTPIEANQRAEFLIRNVDSYHQVYHTYVGRPFPLTVSSDYSAETAEIDIRKETTASVSSSVKEKKDNEQKTVNDIKNREEELKADVAKDEVDPYDEYITLKVKKAQLSWTYLEHIKKMEEIRGIICKTRKQLDELDDEHPDFKDKYYEKYMNARKEAGLKDTPEELEDNFVKHMVEEKPLPGIDGVFTLVPEEIDL
jgi:hypothetical protein